MASGTSKETEIKLTNALIGLTKVATYLLTRQLKAEARVLAEGFCLHAAKAINNNDLRYAHAPALSQNLPMTPVSGFRKISFILVCDAAANLRLL